MSDNNKRLLTEQTIRRFMKLANVGAYADSAIETLKEVHGEEDEEEFPVEGEPEVDLDVPPGGEEIEAELGAEEEMPVDELPVEEPDAGVAEFSRELADRLATDIEGHLEEMGADVSVEGSEAVPEEELPVPEPEGLELPAEEPEGLEGPEGLEEPEEEEIPLDEDLVNEVALRVAARLLKDS